MKWFIMINNHEARRIADAYVEQMSAADLTFAILESETLEEDFGWVFFYDSKAFLETGDDSERVAGNAPFIVERRTGNIVELGSARPTEAYIDDYRRHGDPFATE